MHSYSLSPNGFQETDAVSGFLQRLHPSKRKEGTFPLSPPFCVAPFPSKTKKLNRKEPPGPVSVTGAGPGPGGLHTKSGTADRTAAPQSLSGDRVILSAFLPKHAENARGKSGDSLFPAQGHHQFLFLGHTPTRGGLNLGRGGTELAGADSVHLPDQMLFLSARIG